MSLGPLRGQTGRVSVSGSDRSNARTVWLLAGLLVVAFGVYVVGGYVGGWRWTGLSDAVTLWDWLEALALPVTVALTPLLLRHRRHLHGQHRRIALTALLSFVVLVLAGYLVPMPWTGFTGNTLWDWLSLALLPVVLATATLWPRPEHLPPRHRSALAAGTLAFLVLVVVGYAVPWSWTGFSDNTAWDWVKLLLLPVLLPTLVIPRLAELVDGLDERRSPTVPGQRTAAEDDMTLLLPVTDRRPPAARPR